MTIPYRADHVGSLLRPRSLIEARQQWEQQRLSLEALQKIEDDSILAALELQKHAGLGILSDGEFRRWAWGNGVLDVLDGLGDDPKSDVTTASRWHGNTAGVAVATAPRRRMVIDKIRAREPFAAREASFLKHHAGTAFKITIPSPTMFLRMFVPGTSDRVYANEEEFLEDLLGIYLDEIDGLHRIGVPYIQLDSLRYIDTIDAADRGALDPSLARRTLERLVKADNKLLARARKPGVTRAVHICRGNHRSSWAVKGSYESVAEMLLGQVDTDRFLLEFDDERSGGFEPLRFVPKGKVVVLGLITTKSPVLESLDDLRRRVDAAAKYVPHEYLAIGPQCGFASTHLGNLLTEDEEKRKLALVVEAATKIWG